MTGIHTIRVLNYCGDYDDLNTLHLIGPYATTTERDRDIRRMDRLPGVYGSLQFEASQERPDTADYSCTPEAVSGATDLDGVLIALGVIRPPLDPEPPNVDIPLPGMGA